MTKRFQLIILVVSVLIYSSAANGQWVKCEVATTASLTSVVMLDSTTAIVTGRDRSILRTTDAGASWKNITAALSSVVPWNGISFCDSDNGVVCGDNGVVGFTKNGGLNWSIRSISANKKCLSSLQLDPANVYVGTDSGWVYATHDSGKTWSSTKISQWAIRSIFMYRGPSVSWLIMHALTPYSLCTKQSFASDSLWDEIILSGFQGLGSEAYKGEYCNGGGAGFIVGVQGDFRAAPTILRKALPDTSWQHVTIGISSDGVLRGVSAPTNKIIYTCGSGGMVFKSSDGGDTWSDQSAINNYELNSVYFYDERNGFVVGDNGTILFTSNGGLTDVDDVMKNLPQEFRLEQNYPNPFNPETTIEFALPSSGKYTLKIYNLIGQQVALLVDREMSAGYHKLTFNAAKITSGIYIYQLSRNNMNLYRKMIVMK